MIKKIAKILNLLKEHYPNANIELEYDKNDPWQLLVAVLLSAQSTDKKVNEVTKRLFEKFPNNKSFAQANVIELESYIRSIGLFRSKAKNLINAAIHLQNKFQGKVPNTKEELTSLPGIGNKSANVILANYFQIPKMAVDTHVARLSKRLAFSKEKDPNKIEKDLEKIIPKKDIIFAHHALIWHGRRVCKSQRPMCKDCFLNELCPKIGV